MLHFKALGMINLQYENMVKILKKQCQMINTSQKIMGYQSQLYHFFKVFL